MLFFTEIAGYRSQLATCRKATDFLDVSVYIDILKFNQKKEIKHL